MNKQDVLKRIRQEGRLPLKPYVVRITRFAGDPQRAVS